MPDPQVPTQQSALLLPLTGPARDHIWLSVSRPKTAMTYDYICEACGHAWEAQQSISAEPLKDCPKCGAPKAKRQISLGGGFILKGGGWYSDLYSSPGGGKKEGDKAGTASDKPGAEKSGSEKSGSEKSSSESKGAEAKTSTSTGSGESKSPTSAPKSD